ncbi:MAG: hypothetical protein KAS66_14050 [Candidatus Omnitrophica bacterium]|nr:hypothetical protein [Candidatus Omnitrophota bacterium]
MKESNKDIWETELDAICVTTNGVVTKNGLVMGKGFALQVSERFPGIAKFFGKCVQHQGNVPHLYRNYPLIKESYIISLPTKHHWRDPADIILIEMSIKLLVKIADDHLHLKRIGMTRPGCGSGGLDWNSVKPVIEPLLDDRFIVFKKEV